MLTQKIEDGKPIDTSLNGTSSKTNKDSSGLGKDAFMQLLVAQMQYQDPLQPTDNTQYISQLATFSQLEATQNLESSLSKSLGNELVGKYVMVKTSSGYDHGKVDYTMVENGKVYLSMNNALYSIDELDSVYEDEYFEASQMNGTFNTMVGKLPTESQLTLQDEKALTDAIKYYDAMTDYQKKFMNTKDVEKLEKLEAKMNTLKSGKFTTMLSKLPSADELTIENETALLEVRKYYDALTDDQKKVVNKKDLETLEKLEAKMKELK